MVSKLSLWRAVADATEGEFRPKHLAPGSKRPGRKAGQDRQKECVRPCGKGHTQARSGRAITKTGRSGAGEYALKRH